MPSYTQSSPYYLTPTYNNQYLDFMTNRPIPLNPNDMLWEITPTYHLRPDLLAYDLYEDGNLWWVFAQRNPNKLVDPLFDFVTGASIYIPQLPVLKTALGI
jgi:hypothetical protein